MKNKSRLLSHKWGWRGLALYSLSFCCPQWGDMRMFDGCPRGIDHPTSFLRTNQGRDNLQSCLRIGWNLMTLCSEKNNTHTHTFIKLGSQFWREKNSTWKAETLKFRGCNSLFLISLLLSSLFLRIIFLDPILWMDGAKGLRTLSSCQWDWN